MKIHHGLTKQMSHPNHPGTSTRRTEERYELDVPVTLHILIPEDTFEPHRYGGRTMNASLRGMQVRLDRLTRKGYSRFIARTRHVRVSFEDPENEQQFVLTGRIAWLDYHNAKTRGDHAPCVMGISFAKTQGVDLSAYEKFIRKNHPFELDAGLPSR